jgi:indolepyruvate ferredoxin oxidoreductase, beta subunit
MNAPAAQRPIKLSIAALGGQGGGVLTTWLIQIAEAEGHLVQSTSVPGVAQRTGATIYYLEFFPRAAAEKAGREPVMALLPVPGDVDCVVASELVEAARAIQRGLVTPDRTTLIASSHRSYAIVEKSAMANGTADSEQLIQLARSQAKRLILFDMDAVAESHQSVISSVLLGSICGSGVLPFARKAYEDAIRSSGIAVKTNLAAFEDARARAERGGEAMQAGERSDAGAPLPATSVRATSARAPQVQALLDRVHKLPTAIQPIVLEGVRRTIDYQDPVYADLYLRRVEHVVSLDGGRGESGAWSLAEATARGLALWMTFEDTIRVADLKTRGTRFERVRSEIRADPGQLFGITEFMKPRVQEIAGTMPASLGRWVLRSPRTFRMLARWTGGKQIRTGTISGFMFLYALSGFRRWRRGTLRYQEENARIEDWLSRIERLSKDNYPLAVELARAQRLVKGYGETHERGLRNFTALIDRLDALAARSDGAAVLGRLQKAALADEEGQALARELAALAAAPSGDSMRSRH